MIERETVDFRLPDGRVVGVHADVARFHNFITFTLKGGEVVIAERVNRLRSLSWANSLGVLR